MDVADIKAAMKAQGVRQVDLARHLGLAENKVSKSLSGIRRFTAAEMDRLRELLGSDDRVHSLPPIPIIGQVAAGNWREAVKSASASIPQPDPSIPPRAFALRVQGDSMDREVPPGGTIIVDPEDRALYPERFYVILNGAGETTFKRFLADPARLVPCSTNSEHKDIVIGDGEEFTIVGRVIWKASRM